MVDGVFYDKLFDKLYNNDIKTKILVWTYIIITGTIISSNLISIILNDSYVNKTLMIGFIIIYSSYFYRPSLQHKYFIIHILLDLTMFIFGFHAILITMAILHPELFLTMNGLNNVYVCVVAAFFGFLPLFRFDGSVLIKKYCEKRIK